MFNVQTATTTELVAEYNRLSGKTIKKFSSRAAGEKQVTALLAKIPKSPVSKLLPKSKVDKPVSKAKPPRVAKEKIDKAPANRSESIRRSWTVMATHNARSTRHSVEVHEEGRKSESLQSYRSTLAAFRALKIPEGTHIRFRMELKAKGKNVIDHEGTKFHFAVTSKAEA